MTQQEFEYNLIVIDEDYYTKKRNIDNEIRSFRNKVSAAKLQYESIIHESKKEINRLECMLDTLKMTRVKSRELAFDRFLKENGNSAGESRL